MFSKLEKQVMTASELSEEPTVIANGTGLISSVEMVNSILLVLDISYSVATFLKVCPKAAKIYHLNQMESRYEIFFFLRNLNVLSTLGLLDLLELPVCTSLTCGGAFSYLV